MQIDGHGVYLVVLHDCSAQQRSERELELAAAELAATLESTADGILVTDLAGRIRRCNRRFAELWGLPEDLLLERDDEAIVDWMRRSVVDPAAYGRRLDEIAEATLLQASDVLQLHGGRVLERIVMPQCSRGRPIGRVFSFRDITERIAASRLKEVIFSDSIPLRPEALACGKIRVLSVARLLARAIQSIHEETSVSSLFV